MTPHPPTHPHRRLRGRARARSCSSSPPRCRRPVASLTGLLRSREFSIFLVLVAVTVVATAKNENFLFSSDGWRNFLVNPSLLLLLAVGQAVVIITRNVDLSVGSIMALTAYLTGRLFIDQPGLPIIAVFAICILAGAALGLVNGLLVAYFNVPSLVITLGTLYIYRGHRALVGGQRPGQRRRHAGRLPGAGQQGVPHHPRAHDHLLRRPRRGGLLPLHRPRRP